MILSRGFLIPAYVLSLVMGVGTLLYPPPSVLGVIGPFFTLAYGFLVALGSAGSLWGVIVRNYRFEMSFLWLLGGGVLCYSISLWGIFVDRIINPAEQPPAYGPPLATLALAMILFSKALTLYRRNRQLISASYHG